MSIRHLDTYEGAFIGRAEPLAAFARHFATPSAMVCLCGPAGVGKTRLALHALDTAGGPRWSVDLSSATTLSDVVSGLCDELGLALPQPDDAATQLADALSTWDSGAIVLDNVDGLVACGLDLPTFIRPLQAQAPGLRWVLTSRRTVVGTGVGAAVRELRLSPLTDAESADLLRSRVATIARHRATQLQEAGLRTLAAALDNLPLALVLVAPRLRVSDPAELVDRLAHSIAWLTSSTEPAQRRQSLDAALALSWRALSASARTALIACCVHQAPARTQRIVAMCGDTGAADDALLLLDMGLLRTAAADGPPRLAPFETVRTFVLSHADAEAVRAIRLAHARVLAGARGETKTWLLASYCQVGNAPVADRRDLSAALAFASGLTVAPPMRLGTAAARSEAVDSRRLSRDLALRLSFVARGFGPLDDVYGLADQVRASAILAGDDEAAALAELARGQAMLMDGHSAEGWPLLGRLAEQAEPGTALQISALQGSWLGKVSALGLSAAEDAWQRLCLAAPDAMRGSLLGVFLSAYRSLARDEAASAIALLEGYLGDHNSAEAKDRLDIMEAQLAMAWQAADQPERALPIITRLLAHGHVAKTPRNQAHLHVARARCLMRLHDDARAEEALRAAERAVLRVGSLHPLATLRVARAEIELATGRGHHALTTLESVDRQRAGLDDVRLTTRRHALRGVALLMTGAVAKAGVALGHPPAFALEASEVAFRPWIDAVHRLQRAVVDAQQAKRCPPDALAGLLLDLMPTLPASSVVQPAGTPTESLRARIGRALVARWWPDIACTVLRVAPDGSAFQLDDTAVVALGRRKAQRRLLVALAQQHRDHLGAEVSIAALFAAGWPGVSAVGESGRARVHTAVYTLRQLGVGAALETCEGGYRLNPTVAVVLQPVE